MGFPAVESTLIAKKAAPYISCSVAERWAGQTVVVELQSLLHNVLNFVGERYVEAVARHHFRVAMCVRTSGHSPLCHFHSCSTKESDVERLELEHCTLTHRTSLGFASRTAGSKANTSNLLL